MMAVRTMVIDHAVREPNPLQVVIFGAGLDPARPTSWIREGVVMYLRRAQVNATLA
jgi:O-methyltransferase involved in polyketide biosynthesis